VNKLDEEEDEEERMAYDISEFGRMGLNGQDIAEDVDDVIEEGVVPLIE
jgi:hypothetical protein